MEFPTWIEQERDPLKKAQKRLKYMLNQGALRRYGKASIRTLAAHVPYDHSSIFNAIDRGSFTPQMAEAIERVLGPDITPACRLVSPLTIDGVAA